MASARARRALELVRHVAASDQAASVDSMLVDAARGGRAASSSVPQRCRASRQTGRAPGYRFFRFEALAGHAERGPWSVSKSVVPFESLMDARFWRRLACGDAAVSRGGDPALGERDL
jgi:hypothetical protein